jgi:SPP1 family predicted phage head-tail adaptor
MAKQTQIGERRHRIMFEQPTTSRGTSGQELLTWTRYTEVWAKVTYKMGGNADEMMADRPTTQTAVTFDIAYRDGLNEKMRINFEGDLFDIMYIQKPDFRQSLLITAQRHD